MKIKRKNRKARKKRKMDLKRKGLESFKPDPNEIITTSPLLFPYRIAKHFVGFEIKAGKMRGYEFTREIRKHEHQ